MNGIHLSENLFIITEVFKVMESPLSPDYRSFFCIAYYKVCSKELLHTGYMQNNSYIYTQNLHAGKGSSWDITITTTTSSSTSKIE